MQEMTYLEREDAKRVKNHVTKDELEWFVTIICHWHRQAQIINFTLYASNWIRANKHRFYLDNLERLYPHSGAVHIENGGSDFYPNIEP